MCNKTIITFIIISLFTIVNLICKVLYIFNENTAVFHQIQS
jgi:hypothetical protein